MNIPYEIQEHKAIFSEKDAEDIVITLPGIDVKNLFVKDKHNNYGLVFLNLHKHADLKKIAAEFGYDRLSFCIPDELMQYLAITPGSVTPLCIQADKDCKVKVLFDESFIGQKVIVHPLRNTASISICESTIKHPINGFSIAKKHAYERQSLIITTNLHFNDWGPLFSDDQLAAAIIDRIVHYGHLIKTGSRDWRLEHALMNDR